MCIALLSTAHPRYALIALDNRDEYILRPTSRPHWWTHKASGTRILSPRDLHRRERGTWMGITSTGRLAILTNYRESSEDDPDHAIAGVRSRGALPTAWLSAPADETLDHFVKRMVDDPATKASGGFSLICGDLKNKTDDAIEPLAVISNRCDELASVPRIAGERGATYGLSNTIYVEPPTWPKVKRGKQLLEATIQEAIETDLDEEALMDRFFTLLEDNTIPLRPDMSMQDHMDVLRQSIFIPAFSDTEGWKYMADAVQNGKAKAAFDAIEGESDSDTQLPADPHVNFMNGAYGTQRQTIILIDWEGNVTYKERALWDSHGNRLEKGQGDVIFKYKIGEPSPGE
ncbi:NRDE protein-domain-containing protein [Xylaria bambusicola]|uniref:NRDE protein-domain-containing protein n=1 Tax=Xylaria bambusicola TaxID=326684 RepID=UPI002007E343|nr:NRDE protein-domain-containing protein [Xylaria bambusicola]KAI0505213.1 NRDE protein-domain-containing protein [Xylaria bambusicola]